MSIPASQIVSVTPSVLSAGGAALDLNGVILTQNTRVPIGTAPSFPSYLAVAGYFGANTTEALMAQVYFLGANNSTKRPGALIIYQLNNVPVAGYLRGGSIAAYTTAQLQAAGGTFNVTIDGAAFSTTLVLTSATSQSAVASLVQAALIAAAPTIATFTGAISGTVLTVSAVATGTLAIGQVISGTGITAGTTITALGTGTGLTGTYTVSVTQTVSSTAISAKPANPTVTYDVVSGGLVVTSGTTGANSSVSFATGTAALSINLELTAASGAIVSPGNGNASVMGGLNALLALTTNWACFTTAYEPNAQAKPLYAQWANGQNNRYAYMMWDTLSTTAPQTGDTSSAAYQITQAGYSGTVPIYAPLNGALAGAALLGYAAALDFSAPNGRTDAAFEGFPGLVADVTDGVSSQNLLNNQYNYLGAYATANQTFTFFYDGSITGKFLWLDSYLNQIWLNNQLQLALMTLLTTANSVPYNNAGYAMIEAASADPILAAVSFGAIRSGVTLSAQQASEVNAAAGNRPIATTLSSRGWYLLVADPGAQVRAARGSPICIFFYTDGGDVQAINFSSIDVL